jgi:oligopeptide/dipeptide ABC transporter ATP-binding protein
LSNDDPILRVRDLRTAFDTDAGRLTAVDGASFDVARGKTLGVVGESGCGKSVTALSIMRLLPQPMGHIMGGEILFEGEDLTKLSADDMHNVRGEKIGMIFQEPMTALNPVHRIGRQIGEVYRIHRPEMDKKAIYDACISILEKVGIPSPEIRYGEYPHQLSGGMRQRAMIAMALALKPGLLIADEPTTALDVTVQAQILSLIAEMQAEMGMSVLLITHDLGVIAETCDEVVVMYAGRVVERAPARELFAKPRHAYTQGLLNSIPRLDSEPKSVLATIPGSVAGLAEFVPGCRFCQRMERDGETLKNRPELEEVAPDHWAETCPECYHPA